MSVAASPVEIIADPLAAARPVSLWRDTLRNVLRQRNAVVGLVLLGFLLLTALFADQLSVYLPNTVLSGKPDMRIPTYVYSGRTDKSKAPCIHVLGCNASEPEHVMGTDSNVRDEFSRVVHGARISLFVGFATVGFAIIVGAAIGLVAGYAGGWTDNILMRLMDVLLVFPSLLLAIAIVTALGQSLINAQIAIGIVAIPIYARIMRASVLAVKENDFVTAARALGEGPLGLLVRRILPNSITPLIVAGTLGIGTAVLDVAAL